MKLFLKSIAFFASFALLLTACGDDDTTDAGGGSTIPKVESSTISSAVPGNGKIQVVWNVPYNDNITTSRVSWSGTATNYVDCTMKYLVDGLEGAELAEVLADQGLDSYSYGEDYITLTRTLTLTAGTYTISVESLGKVALNTKATTYDSDIVVYDASTYTSHPEVAQITYDGTDAYITWGEVPADLTKVIIGYYKASADTNFEMSASAITEANIVNGGSVTLAGAVKDTYYTLTSYFLPEGTLSESEFVVLAEDDHYRQIPKSETAAAAPTNVSVMPGVGRIKVAWTAPEGTVKSIIAVKDASGTPLGSGIELSDTALKVGDEENVIYIYNQNLGYDTDASSTGALAAGAYTVEIYNQYNSASSDSEVVSKSANVYTAASYASYLPIVASAQYADNAVITWANTAAKDLESVMVIYANKTYTTLAADLAGGTEFSVSSGDASFTYTSTFVPEGGFEKLAVVTTSQTLNPATTVDIEYNSSGSRYDIYTAKGLKAFADLVNGNANTTGAMLRNMQNSFGLSNTKINGRVCATIDLSDLGADVSWEGMEDYGGQFCGGNALSPASEIKNLYIRSTSSTQGLFASTVKGAEIYQVTLIDPVVQLYDVGTVGALVGNATSSEITQCYVKNESGKAEVSIYTNYGVSKTIIGGVIGRSSSSYVFNCHNEGVPVLNQSTTNNTMGGFIGYISGDTDLTNSSDETANFVNCSNSGSVTAAGDGYSVGGFAGNIAGLCNFVGCANTGDVSGGSYVAGIVGYVTGSAKFAACYNTGTITSSATFVGGITGRVGASEIDVVSCYNMGEIRTTYEAGSSKAQATGCIVGTGGTVTSSVYTASVTLQSCYYVYKEPSEGYYGFCLGIGSNTTAFAGVVSDMSGSGVEKLAANSDFSSTIVTNMNTALATAYGSEGALSDYKYGEYEFVQNVNSPYNPLLKAK